MRRGANEVVNRDYGRRKRKGAFLSILVRKNFWDEGDGRGENMKGVRRNNKKGLTGHSRVGRSEEGQKNRKEIRL